MPPPGMGVSRCFNKKSTPQGGRPTCSKWGDIRALPPLTYSPRRRPASFSETPPGSRKGYVGTDEHHVDSDKLGACPARFVGWQPTAKLKGGVCNEIPNIQDYVQSSGNTSTKNTI